MKPRRSGSRIGIWSTRTSTISCDGARHRNTGSDTHTSKWNSPHGSHRVNELTTCHVVLELSLTPARTSLNIPPLCAAGGCAAGQDAEEADGLAEVAGPKPGVYHKRGTCRSRLLLPALD